MTTVPTTAEAQFRPDGVPEIRSSVKLTGNTHILCCAYPDRPPILAIDEAHVRISVTVPDAEQVTGEDVQWGRVLADAVARYVAELERLTTGNPDAASKDEAA